MTRDQRDPTRLGEELLLALVFDRACAAKIGRTANAVFSYQFHRKRLEALPSLKG